jgi:hypothetical protein
MSVHGIGPTIPDVYRGEPARRPEDSEGAEAARSPRPDPATEQRTVAPAVPDGGGDLQSVPEGVDAELWSLLTTEERAHFARFAAMGGVTYGPRADAPSRPPVRGHRLDLRI